MATAAFLVLCGWTASSQSEKSVWDGIYTQGQAARGQKVFDGICAQCHAASDFEGSTFLMNWENSTVYDLFRQVQRTMPMEQPGSLSPQEYIDVISYVFSVNKFPAGDAELDLDEGHLKLIRVEAKKK